MAEIITLQNICQKKQKGKGLHNISLTIDEGEIFGLVGAKQSGKTALMRILLDMAKPESGRATILGLDAQKHSSKIRQKVGFVPSKMSFYEDMRVREFLNYNASFYKANCSKRIGELCDYFMIDPKVRIEDLTDSGKKLLAIIQAFSHNPQIAFLDEPSQNLEPVFQHRLYEFLKEEHKKGDLTLIIASGFFGEVQRLCHRLALLRKGELIDTRDISYLRENTFIKVRAVCSEPIETLALAGVTDLYLTEDNLEFLYRGNVQQLLTVLATLPLHSLFLEDPNAEDIFYYYYSKD